MDIKKMITFPKDIKLEHMKKSIVYASLLFIITSLGFSQSLRVAHVNVSDVMNNLSEAKTVQEKLNALEQKHSKELQRLIGQIQAKIQECEKSPSNKKSSCVKEVNNLQQRAQIYQRTAGESLVKEQEKAFSYIYSKVEKVIREVANNKNLEYVLDSSPGKGVIVANSIDLTQEIKNKLGK